MTAISVSAPPVTPAWACAHGTYIVWLDSDDWIGSGYLSQLVRVIERLGCDFVRTDHVRVLGRRRTIIRSPETPA